MNTSIWKDTTVVIIYLTLVAIGGIHYFEIGYCKYFGIPEEFISFEMSRYTTLLVFALSAAFALGFLIDGTLRPLIALWSIKKLWLRITLSFIFLGITIAAFWKNLYSIDFSYLLIFLCPFFLGMALYINAERREGQKVSPIDKVSIILLVARKWGKSLGPALMALSVVCVLLLYMGVWVASSTKTFSARPDNKTILLRIYGNNQVMGTVENSQLVRITIEQNLSKTDTFHDMRIPKLMVAK